MIGASPKATVVVLLLLCLSSYAYAGFPGDSQASGEGSGSESYVDRALDFESCLSCLDNEYHWCLYPEPACRDRFTSAANCTVYRSPSTGCFGLVHFNLTETELTVLFIFVAFMGLVMLLAGHRIIKPTLFTVGMVSGFIIGGTVMYYIMSHTKKLQWPIWVTGLVLGMVFGFFALKFLRAGIMLLGAFTGAVIFMLLYGTIQEAGSLEYNENWAYGMMAFGGSLFGLLALWSQRRILIVGTSFLGAYAVARSIMFWTKHQINVESALTGGTVADREGPGVVWAYIGGIAFLGCLGMWFQFRAIKKKKYHEGKYYDQNEEIPVQPKKRRLRRAPTRERWYRRRPMRPSRSSGRYYSRVHRHEDSDTYDDYYSSDIEYAPVDRRSRSRGGRSAGYSQRSGSRRSRGGTARRQRRGGARELEHTHTPRAREQFVIEDIDESDEVYSSMEGRSGRAPATLAERDRVDFSVSSES
eukprot:TRINITY_DN28653_c0_g1_i1.p1 TRINITY_DN28653_c0_g1~~TRINITY_DN28653_c0_g1_i1.p1  ORF type:complete len:471 (-),score=40.71 TRINITY_DN28653_c0_g1_i1:72-1484(-)